MTQKNSEGYLLLNVNDFRYGKVIFTEQGDSIYNRYPTDINPGMEIGGRSKLFGTDYAWTDYKEPEQASSGKIRFDIGDWNPTDRISFYIWARKGDQLLYGSNTGWTDTNNWGSKKTLGTAVEDEEGIVESYQIDYLDGWDHFVIFYDYDSGAQTYDCIFTKDAFGKTAHLTGNELENPLDSSLVCIEADFEFAAGSGPYMQITSTGNIIGRIPALHDDGVKIVAEYIYNNINKIDKSGVECCTPEKVSNAVSSYYTVPDDVWEKYTEIDRAGEKANEAHILLFGTPLSTDTDSTTDTETDTDTQTDPNYEYTVNYDGSITITKYKGSSSVLNIPSEINGRSVTAIGEEAFTENYTITSVTVPDSVTEINRFAFYKCYNLTSISLPQSTTEIGTGILSDCPSITKITVSEDNSALEVIDGILYNRTTSEVIKCPVNKETVNIPDYYTTIGQDAFAYCKNLTLIRIPSSITTIDKWAFDNCTGLTKVYLPSSVTTIGDSAFDYCSALTDVCYEGDEDSLFDSIYIGNYNDNLVNANIHYNTVSGKIRFDLGNWNHSDRVCFYIWARTPDQKVFYAVPDGLATSDTWGSKKLIGTPAQGEDGIVESYYIEYTEDYDYFVIFHDYETNEQTYDCVFTKDAFGQTAFMTGLEIENPVNSEKTSLEADFNNVPGCGPYLQIASTGNIIGYAEAKHDDAPALVANYIFKQMGVITLAGKEACTQEKVAYAISAYDTTEDEVWAKFQQIEGHEPKDSEAYWLIYRQNIIDPSDTDSDFSYTVQDDDTIKITGYNGSDNDVAVPGSIEDKPVTAIGDSAFYGNKNMTSVQIPSSVKTIGASAFYDCTNLNNVSIPDGVSSIDRNAFYNCSSLDSVNIPSSVKTIGFQSFFDCTSLTDLTIQDGVESIGGNAFYNCSRLQILYIPYSVTEIGENAFCRCSNLNYISVSSDNTTFTTYDGALYNKDTKTLIKCPVYQTSVYIDNDTKVIGQMAFQDCTGLTNIVFPDGLTTIGKWAFQNCINISEVTIPTSVTTISDNAFYDCDNLKDVYYRGNESQWNNITIGSDNAPLKKAALHFPDDGKVTYYFLAPNNYFAANNDVGYYYWQPQEIAPWPGAAMTPAPEIGENVFKCSVGDMDTTSTIIFNAFVDAGNPADPDLAAVSHQSVNINLEGYDVGDSKFYDKLDNFYGMIYVYSPDNFDINEYYGSEIRSGEWFSVNPGDDNYYRYYLDSSGQYYTTEKNTDTDTTTDTDTEDSDTPPDTNPDLFEWGKDDTGYYISAYTGTDTVITIPIETEGHTITTVKRTKKEINEQAAKITKIYVSEGITTIGKMAFRDYTALEEIILPNSVTTIGNDAFYNCQNLRKITIPNGLKSIGSNAFYNCQSLNKITLPDGLTNIGSSAFYNCNNLTEITVPGGVNRISMAAFKNCSALISVTISDGVETIDDSAFSDCTSLTMVTIPESIKSINHHSFYKCTNLKDVYYGGSEEDWNTLLLSVGSDNPALTAGATIHFGREGVPKDFYVTEKEDGTLEIIKYNGNDSVMNIPSEIDGKTVTSIGSNILMHGDTAKNVLEIVIPETVTAIADNAFSLCQTLEKVTIPDSVTEIGKDVFTDYGNVRIYCSTDSAAHKYAQDNNIGFILTDGGYEPVKLGDVDGDGKISAKDSMTIQRYAINLKKLEPNQIRAADADGDGRVTNKDAIILLRYTINIPVKFAIGEMV